MLTAFAAVSDDLLGGDRWNQVSAGVEAELWNEWANISSERLAGTLVVDGSRRADIELLH